MFQYSLKMADEVRIVGEQRLGVTFDQCLA